MTLAPGSRLGNYEIVDRIGAGGMGEVYKGLDTKLGRDVAIKVLPETFARDKERLARFEREARIVAQLNHPNIAAIYGLEERDGVHFLVLEYVPGETLADRIARGALTLEEALDIFAQIARALEAAHEKGIVHRDLKPSNIMITPDGVVKILDFGLAKAFREEAPVSVQSESPTLTREGTRTGVVMGTAPYMSPEQARGKTVDKRTDIWAFGCCLYEALTGKSAFLGETVSDTIAAVLGKEPDWERLPPLVPETIRRLLRRCLQKEPNRRIRDVWDARVEMEESLSEPLPEAADGEAGRKRASTPFNRTALAAIIVAVTATGMAIWSFTRSTTAVPDDVTRLAIPLSPGQDPETPVLSPDGRHLVLWGALEDMTRSGATLYLRSMDQLEASPIPGTEDAIFPFFSPDSRWIGFFAGGLMKKVLVTGGTPVTIRDAPRWVDGATWAPDGTVVIGNHSLGLQRVSAEGDTAKELTRLELEKGDHQNHSTPQVLPDGKSVLFTIVSAGGASIGVASTETGEYRTLLQGSDPRYVPTGHLVYVQSGSLLAVPFDLESLEITGTPVPVLDGVYTWRWGGLELGLYTISNTGSLVYAPGGESRRRDALVWVDRDGRSTPVTEQKGNYAHPRISPDGKGVAVSRQTEEGRNIWFFDVERGTWMRFTFEGTQWISCWTPDGDRLTFDAQHAGGGIYWKEVGGNTPVEPLLVGLGTNTLPCSWSPDAAVLAYVEESPATKSDISILRRDGGGQPLAFADTAFNEAAPVFSSDGRFLAYVTDESGRPEVYVQPYPVTGEKHLVSTDGGRQPVWSADGRELFYRHGDEMLVVDVELEPELRLGQPRVLFLGPVDPALAGTRIQPPNYDVSADGRRFIMVERGERSAMPTQLNVVLNWDEELKRLVPTGN